MRWNIADKGDQGTADPGVWESVEITPIAAVASTGHPRVTFAGGLLVLVAVVSAGLWPGTPAEPPAEAGVQPCPTPVSTPEVPEPTSVTVIRPRITLLMPSPGEVILGTSVLVAGRVDLGRPRTELASSSSLHIVIVVEDTPVGEADLPIDGNGFAGSLSVVEQARGQIAEIRISDGRRPDDIVVQQTLVLGPGD